MQRDPRDKKRLPTPTGPQPTVEAFPQGYGRIVSGELNYLMRQMMERGADGIAASSDQWPVANLAGESVTAEVLFTPSAQSPEPLVPEDQSDLYRKRMWYLVKGMDDLTADCWDALMAQWVAEAKSPDAKVWVNVDQILGYRGLAANTSGGGRRGGYSAVQRAAVTECLLRIMAMRLQILSMTVLENQEDEGGGRRLLPAQRQIGGPALEVGMDLTQTDFLGRTEIKALLIRPGEVFARYYLGAGRPVAVLSQQALAYHPIREAWEKRLTRYFAYHWDRRSQEGVARQRYSVVQLLEAVHQPPNPQRPDDTKERLEKALRRLAVDGVIAGWDYVADTWDESTRPPRKWLSIWLAATIEILAPEPVRRFYELALPEIMAPAALAPGLPPQIADGQLTGGAIEALRQHVGLTQQEFADQLGVTRSLIALVETGRRAPSAKLQNTIRSWLDRMARRSM